MVTFLPPRASKQIKEQIGCQKEKEHRNLEGESVGSRGYRSNTFVISQVMFDVVCKLESVYFFLFLFF
jgi:hypothetical protein